MHFARQTFPFLEKCRRAKTEVVLINAVILKGKLGIRMLLNEATLYPF